MTEARKEELGEIFDMCDANEDGDLSKAEIEKSAKNNKDIAKMLKIPTSSENYLEYIDTVFKEMDADHSDKVSRDEFISYFCVHDCKQAIKVEREGIKRSK